MLYVVLFPVLFFFISLIGLVLASISDLRERVVANKLTYSLFFLGIFLHVVYFAFDGNLVILSNVFFAIAIAFLFSLLLYRFGMWAGGDVKLFTALAALNPINYNVLGLVFPLAIFASIKWPIFPITLFIFSIFAMFPYGVGLAVGKLRGRKTVLDKIVNDAKARFVDAIAFSLFIVGLLALLNYFSMHWAVAIPLIIAFGFLKNKVNMVALVLALAVFLFSFYLTRSIGSFIEFVLIFVVLFFGVLLFRFFLLSRELLKRNIKITKLEEGVIPAETIVAEKGEIIRVEGLSVGKIINYIKHNELGKIMESFAKKGGIIVSSRNARGVTEEEIAKLKDLVKKGKIEDKIMVKESAPMVPAILIAYIILNIVGDLFWNLV